MKKKLFVTSDIHNNYKALRKGLDDAGYDENDENNLLIVIGDIFDRPPGESVAIYEYLKRLTDEGKAIVTRGNHEKFFIDFLQGSVSAFNYLHNGTNETIADFWHRTAPFESWCALEGDCNPTQESYIKWAEICRNEIKEEYPELLKWLKDRPRYFETKNYIFTHGAIDSKTPDWHNPHCYKYDLVDWDALDFNDGTFFGESIVNTDKTIVIGHFGTNELRKMYGLPIEEGHEYDILTRDDGRVIALDATTVISNKINVLVVEDELI